MDLTKQGRRTILICVALSAVTLAAFWPVTGSDFINFDDQDYVTNNPHVTGGIRWSSVAWAFKTGHVANWHPVTWLSHMLDCQLYGLRPAGHHLTNLLFHAANTVLLFLLLQRMTSTGPLAVPGSQPNPQPSTLNPQLCTTAWPCFFVAALFALHPLHVESVAWVAERKDVLSGFFFLLTLLAYVRYAEVVSLKSQVSTPQSTVRSPPSTVRSPQSTVHSPPSTVRSPQSTDDALRSTLHALRFYLLALLFFALGLMSKPMLVTVPFVLLLLDYWPLRRMQNPSPRAFSLQPLAFSLLDKLPFLALSAASCVVTFLVQRRAGAMASLDLLPLGFRLSNALISCVRYLLKTVWPAELTVFYPPPAAWPLEWVVGAAFALVAVSALAVWLVRKAPWFAFGWFWYLGTLMPVIGIVQVGSQAMADRYCYIPLIGLFVAVAWGAAELAARRPGSRAWLAVAGASTLVVCGGLTYRQTGYWRTSQRLFEHALAVTSGNFVAHYALGAVFTTRGDAATAERHLAEAVRLRPYDADAQVSLAATLASVHQPREAVKHYQEALKLQPNLPDALNNLAWILAANPDPEVRDGKKAVELAERACKLTDYKEPMLVGTLAAAYAEAGRFPEAVATAEKARRLAEQANQPDIAARNRALLELYRAGQPARDAL